MSPTRIARPAPATLTAKRLTATGVGNGVSRCSTTPTRRTLAENRAMRLDQRASGANIVVDRSLIASSASMTPLLSGFGWSHQRLPCPVRLVTGVGPSFRDRLLRLGYQGIAS